MNRTPPQSVRRQLRHEVGFGCPVQGCDNPYLSYHHFDPTWAEREHHDARGMIALCQPHHAKADGGAFTTDQLRALKSAPPRPIAGRFDWMRRKLLAVAGGNIFYETPILVQYKDRPVIWFERDTEGHALLSLEMLSQVTEPRLSLQRNDWVLLGNAADLVCPPNGRLIRATFPNGDDLAIEFRNIPDLDSFLRGFHHFYPFQFSNVEFPVTVVEIHMAVGGTNLRLGPTESTFGGARVGGNVFSGCQVGVALS